MKDKTLLRLKNTAKLESKIDKYIVEEMLRINNKDKNATK